MTEPDARRIETLVTEAMPRIVEVTKDMEFETFQTACRAPREMAGAEESEREGFRVAARVALLRRLETLWPRRRLKGVGHDVKVTLLPDAPRRAAVFVEPIFVAGRYRKLVRGLSQTVFHCRVCRGRRRDGCDACGGTRLFVAESVEEFVRAPIVAALEARRTAFHGAGREDVDVRMLGDGRPFVVSAQWARFRSIDGGAVAGEVERLSAGRVLVSDVRVVPRAEARRITTEHGAKTYRAVVRSTDGRALPADAALLLAPLVGVPIAQRTPVRVERRRADVVRTRRILALAVEELRGVEMVVTLATDAGAYVKELVSGDGGRTEPSFASALRQPSVVVVLDVISSGLASAAGRTL